MNLKSLFAKYHQNLSCSNKKQIQQEIASDYPIFVVWNASNDWLRIRNTNMLICWNPYSDFNNWYISNVGRWLKSDEFELDLREAMRLQSYDGFLSYDIPEIISRIPDDIIKQELLEALISLSRTTHLK